MSALRAASRPARSLSSFARQSRLSSTAAHNSHHHPQEEHDVNAYAKETFFTPFWTRTVLVALGLIAFAKYAPAEYTSGKTLANGEHEVPWFTRVLTNYAPSNAEWVKTNENHLSRSEEKAQDTLAFQSAKLPGMPTRNKLLKFEQISPHRVPVGGLPEVELDNLVIKP